jgi:hypothetical protein
MPFFIFHNMWSTKDKICIIRSSLSSENWGIYTARNHYGKFLAIRLQPAFDHGGLTGETTVDTVCAYDVLRTKAVLRLY